jgi:acyl-CoA synthetase (AMP-forming)/AMP-acid ligase II/thioesterase domain-containing protein/acyl carrier protein
MLDGRSSPAIDRTIPAFIRDHARERPHAPAILSSGGEVPTYEALQRHIDAIAAGLTQAGISAGTRVAIVMPDGPELAVAIVAVACSATAVPLNPNLTAAEFEGLFVAQKLEALVLADWAESAAEEVAKRRGMCVLAAARVSGWLQITLRTAPLAAAAKPRALGPDDTAFILRTSGTTARPKLVPITHRNLVAMAGRLQKWFALVPEDRILCILPLYYAQGLKISLFVPLILGSSLACPARSPDADILTWLAELEPTWFTAGPTLLRAMLERVHAIGRSGLRQQLRVIVSAAAPIPDTVRDGLADYFGVPVLNAFGLSEAGLVAANELAPEGRKPGTAGKFWPGELAIWNADEGLVGPDTLGEIVVRGPGVTPGYIDDPEMNRATFVDGWFHTGDLGRIDTDGFLTIVGRIKEMINRGGEKIAPAEIDQALLRHPAVAEATSFAVPHPRLGEDIAAAVVLHPGHTITPLELRRYLKPLLVSFKIPRRIHILAAIPKGDTGKVRRQDLPALIPAPAKTGPTLRPSSLESQIAEIWRRLLGCAEIDGDDEFFELGGDSLLATQMILEVERLTGKQLPEDVLFEAATPRQIAQRVIESDKAADQGLMVQLQTGTGKPPFVLIDGDFWGGGLYARQLAVELGPEFPFYNFHSHGCYTDKVPSIAEMAAEYRQLLAAAGVRGPFRLGGHCNGAIVAWELARQLIDAGERVELVAMIEAISLNARPSTRAVARGLEGIARLGLGRDGAAEGMGFLWRVAQFIERCWSERKSGSGDNVEVLAERITEHDPLAVAKFAAYRRAMAAYVPPKLDIDVLCLVAQSHVGSRVFSAEPWRRVTPRLEVEIVPGEHLTCITTHVDALARRLRERLLALDGGGSTAGTDASLLPKAV